MISTYPGLTNAILGWVNNAEVTQNVDSFVRLAEAQINRRLTCREMWDFSALQLEGWGAYLPQDFLAVETVRLSCHHGKLTYVSPQLMDERHHNWFGGWGGWREYTVVGNRLIVDPWFVAIAPAVPNATPPEPSFVPPPVIARVRYRRRVDALGPANPTNWLIEKHPDVYLYGALAQTKAFLEDDARADKWEAAFVQAMADIQTADMHTISDTLEMMPDVGDGGHRRRFDREYR